MVFFFFLSRLFFFRFVSGDGLLLLLIEALLLSLLLLRVKTSEEFRRRTLSLVEAEAHLRELGARLELRALRHGRRPRGLLLGAGAELQVVLLAQDLGKLRKLARSPRGVLGVVEDALQSACPESRPVPARPRGLPALVRTVERFGRGAGRVHRQARRFRVHGACHDPLLQEVREWAGPGREMSLFLSLDNLPQNRRLVVLRLHRT